MGLDASVYCNCYEVGLVRTPPPQPAFTYIDEETGQVSLRWDAPGADQILFSEWLASACEHDEFGRLIHHRLGNAARIGILRSLFETTPERFPILLSKVVYSGTHCGDFLTLEYVDKLAAEMALVPTVHCDAADEDIVRQFQSQMAELIEAARSVQRPIVF
jgi:hypothetical protein